MMLRQGWRVRLRRGELSKNILQAGIHGEEEADHAAG